MATGARVEDSAACVERFARCHGGGVTMSRDAREVPNNATGIRDSHTQRQRRVVCDRVLQNIRPTRVNAFQRLVRTEDAATARES